MLKINKKYKIKTPDSWKNFSGIQLLEKRKTYCITTEKGKKLNCTSDHKLKIYGGSFKELVYLGEGDVIETIDGFEMISSITPNQGNENVYDITNVGTKHEYYTNGIISHNCHFIGSANTLINPAILRNMKASDPIIREPNIDIYELPISGHTYVLLADVSEGQNLDYSAFQIIDVTSIPYRQVAKYRDNKIAPVLFPTMIYAAAKKYNDAYVLVEINTVGLQVADILHLEFNYENLVRVAMKGRQGQRISAGFLPKVAYGVKTSTQTKRIGCSNLKTLVESEKLLIRDFDTISELHTFVQNKQSFAAEEGYNDDLVMGLVNFGWLISQRNFKENINSNIREFLQSEKIRSSEEDSIIPFGVIDTGHEQTREVDADGDVWEVDDRYISPVNGWLL
jgi:hypothetical protein